MMGVLFAATPAGATKLTLTGPTAPAQLFVVGQYLPEAELCRALSVVGKTVTLAKPLASAKPAKCIVQPFDGGLVPWSWYGAKSGSTAFASDNVLAFNRLAQQIYDLGVGVTQAVAGIVIGTGYWYVNGELRPERDTITQGAGVMASQIHATPDFPFDTTGEVAMFHPLRDGQPVIYAAPGPSGRWGVRDLFFNGNNVPNSNGILSSPQQPDALLNVRVDNCAGLYGLCLVDVQDCKLFNIELIGNYCGLRYRGTILVRCYGLNIEQTKGPSSFISEGVPGGNQSFANSFDGVHLEQDQEQVSFDFRDGSTGIGISNLFYSNPQIGTCLRFDTPLANPGNGKSRYFLSNIWCNANSNDYKMVEDVQRGKSLNSFSDTDRWIDWLTPERLLAWPGPTPY